MVPFSPILLERAFRNWQRGHLAPEALLSLQMVDTLEESSLSARNTALHEYITTITLRELQQSRLRMGLPHADASFLTLEQMLDTLTTDFQYNNRILESWSALYYRYLAPIPLAVQQLAIAARVDPRQFRRRVLMGLNALASLLNQTVLQLHHSIHIEHLRRYLPPLEPYLTPFGILPLVNQVATLLIDPQGPRFISIEGIGGIGKTTLAQAVAYRLSEESTLGNIIWISAQHQQLNSHGDIELSDDPVLSLDDVVTQLVEKLGQNQLAGLSTTKKLERIETLLRKTPHLIIIDNLETIADNHMLVPAIYRLAGATRFLLTSRRSLSQHGYVRIFPVPSLSLNDSHHLIQREVSRRRQTTQVDISLTRELHAVIGGLPLALKLTAAQLGHIPLVQILRGLRQVRRDGIEHMYTFIYRQTWQLLNDGGKSLLLSMIDVSPDGEDVSWIRLMNALGDMDFDVALDQLRDYSLLEITGSITDPLYRIHRLTATFLQSDILQRWKDNEL